MLYKFEQLNQHRSVRKLTIKLVVTAVTFWFSVAVGKRLLFLNWILLGYFPLVKSFTQINRQD